VSFRLCGEPLLKCSGVDKMKGVSVLSRIGTHEVGRIRHGSGLIGLLALGKRWLMRYAPAFMA